MRCWALVLFSMMLPDSATTRLPAPLNVVVDSVNFHHVLKWDPGPGTPPQTQYLVYQRVYRQNQIQLNSSTTSLKLKLKSSFVYQLTVQALYNRTKSPVSKKCTFSPYKDTRVGPPEVSLTGCGNCIQINISLPEADRDSEIDDIQKFYGSDFRVLCKSGKKEVGSYIIQNKSFTLHNLHRGEEYCVQVHTEIVLNKNTEPSAWKCIFTSAVEQRNDSFVLVVVAVLLIFFVGVLITIMFGLHYTGFLCKLRPLPAVLMDLGQGCTMTPEGTIPDPVSTYSQIEKQRQHNNLIMQLHARGNEDEDEEEEEVEEHVYMDRAARCAAGESLCLGSGNMLVHSEPATAADCGSLTERLSAEVVLSDAGLDDGVTRGGPDEDLKAAGTKVPRMPEERPTRLQGHVTGGEEDEGKEDETKKEKKFGSCGNVNLFSVTLAALTVGEEEEEEEEEEEDQNGQEHLSNFLKLPDLEPLRRVPKWSLSNTDSQTQSDDQATVRLMKDTQKDFTESGYEGLRANSLSDDDIISEYMAHT